MTQMQSLMVLLCLFFNYFASAEAKYTENFSKLSRQEETKSLNIGLTIVATGRYIQFVNPLIESAQKYFCKNHHVTYFVFTDQNYQTPENTICIFQKKLGWPYDSMMRYHIYHANKEIFEEQDYIFAIDADMLFVGDVGDEIISDHTAAVHQFSRGPYETNPQSKAAIGPQEGKYYYCGGIYGGAYDRFFDICKTNMENIDDDLSRGIIAIWHDESHWNRYCIDHEPPVILPRGYWCPDYEEKGYTPKILALSKNHAFYRE